jgi:hypothetical protein
MRWRRENGSNHSSTTSNMVVSQMIQSRGVGYNDDSPSTSIRPVSCTNGLTGKRFSFGVLTEGKPTASSRRYTTVTSQISIKES